MQAISALGKKRLPLSVRCDKYRFGKPHASRPPNRRLQLTPLRGPEIVRILKTDFGYTVIPI
jgi:hypothetical protein